jgi:DNA-binding MarR family transcriptional regulator
VELDGAGEAEAERLLDGDVEEAELLQLLGPGQGTDVQGTQATIGGELGDLLLGVVVAGDQDGRTARRSRSRWRSRRVPRRACGRGRGQLAAVTSASLSRLSNVVKRLERRGYLRRQADPDDGRCTQAVLTDAGMAKVVETAPGHVAAARKVVIDAVTPAQLRQLRAANDRILARIDPEATTRPPPIEP